MQGQENQKQLKCSFLLSVAPWEIKLQVDLIISEAFNNFNRKYVYLPTLY